MKAITTNLLLEAMASLERDVTVFDITDYLFPDVDHRSRSLYSQRIRCRLKAMEEQEMVFRTAYLNRTIMWSLHRPEGYIPRKKGATADPYVYSRISKALETAPQGMDYGELMEVAYGHGAKIDQYELMQLKRAIREMKDEGKIMEIENLRCGSRTWRMIP